MKFLFPAILILFSFPLYAFPLTQLLYCSTPNGFDRHVNVMATDQANYRIILMDQFSHPLPVYHSELTFNEAGEIMSITASATVELLELWNINDSWQGVYWLDNLRHQLTCKNIVR